MMVAAFPIWLMLVVGFVVALAVVAGAKSGRGGGGAGRVAAIGALVVAVLAAVLMFFGLFSARSRVVVQSARPQAMPAPGTTAIMRSGHHVMIADSNNAEVAVERTDDWIDAFESDASAPREPHTSLRTLNKFMADRVGAAIDRVSEVGSPRYVEAEPHIPASLRNEISQVAGSFRRKPEGAAETDTVITLRTEGERVESRTTWWPSEMLKATIVAEVRGPNGTETVNAKLDEKPWLDTPPSSVGRQDFIVVKAGPPAASREEALDALRGRTVSEITSAITTRAAAQAGVRPTAADARRQAEDAVARWKFTDQAVVALDRPYGRVWFAASLVQVNPHDVANLATAAQGVVHHRHQTWATMAMSLGGMLAVLGVLYVALNTLTRGYFRAHVGAALAVVLVLGVIAIVLLMG